MDKKATLAGDYSDITTQIYSEYGLTNKMEALLILPLKSASFKANSEIQQQLDWVISL
jgi:hypothetical protein